MNRREREQLGRLRVNINLFAGLVLLSAIALQLRADEPSLETRALPFANANGYTSTRCVVNPTDEPLPVLIDDRFLVSLYEWVEPHSLVRTSNWPRAGVNVEYVEADPRLDLYVEIKTPRGTFVRVDPLAPVISADFYDLPTDAVFLSQVFAVAPGGDSGVVSIRQPGSAAAPHDVSDEVATLVRVGGDHVSIVTGYDDFYPPRTGPAFIYTFAIVEHDETGAINVVYPAESVPYVQE